MKFNFSKQEKWLMVFLCLIMFLSSNTTMIYGGSCDSSPCGGLNQSDASDNGEWIMDYSGATISTFFLAPLNLLTPTILNLVDNYTINKDKEVVIAPIYQFDQKNEIVTPGDKLPKSDVLPLLKAFLTLKILTLLNLPLWIFIISLLIKLEHYSRIGGGLATFFLVIGLIGIKLFMIIELPNYDSNILNLIQGYKP